MTSVPLVSPLGILPANTYLFKHFYKHTVSEEISTPVAFQPLLQPDNSVCFFRDLWSSISKRSHCFILPNGFSNLLWRNVIVALCVNSKWAYTDFISCVQLVTEHQPAILPAVLQKSCLTPKNMGGAFAMKFLKSLGLDAQWGHTVKRTLITRNFLCPLQTFFLPERCLPHAGKGVFVIWCTSLFILLKSCSGCLRSQPTKLICGTHTGQGDALRQQRPHLWPPVMSTKHMFCSPVTEEAAKTHSTHHQTRTVFTSAGKAELVS